MSECKTPRQENLPGCFAYNQYGLLQISNCFSDFVFCLAGFLLYPTPHFVFFTFFVCQIVVCQVTVCLFDFAFELVPRSFDCCLVHDVDSLMIYVSAVAAYTI